jgi:hypothetical protein
MMPHCTGKWSLVNCFKLLNEELRHIMFYYPYICSSSTSWLWITFYPSAMDDAARALKNS